MITGTKKELDQIVKSSECSEHGVKLVVAWHAGENSYVIRCGEGHFPEEIESLKSRTKQYKVGELEPVGEGLDLLPKVDLGTGEALSSAMSQLIVSYAKRYRLDPYRGHVLIMYGKPYIGIDGYLFYAHQEHISFTLGSRPLGADERKDYQVDQGDHAWTAEVAMLPAGGKFNGLGIVTKTEMEAKSPRDVEKLRSPVVAAHPWQLAQKRAEWQALRRAFPVGESPDPERSEG